MSLARLVRSAGLLSMVAAALIVVSEIVAFLSGGIGLINGVVRVVAFFLLLLGLVGLYARQSEEAGKLGLAGFHLAFLGTMLLAGDLWFEAFAVPGGCRRSCGRDDPHGDAHSGGCRVVRLLRPRLDGLLDVEVGSQLPDRAARPLVRVLILAPDDPVAALVEEDGVLTASAIDEVAVDQALVALPHVDGVVAPAAGDGVHILLSGIGDRVPAPEAGYRVVSVGAGHYVGA